MPKKINKNIFIKNANLIHNNLYDYSKVEYVGCKFKIAIICPIHGEFRQTPDKHLRSQGCPKCVGHNKSTEDFINEAKKIHGNKYGYSLVNYLNVKEYIRIICPIHGEFHQTPDKHLHASGCPKCGYINSSSKQASVVEEFIRKANLVHNNKYDYSLVNYLNAHTKIKITCKKHGIFEQTPTNHLSGKGCLLCKKSKGEMNIKNFLIDNNITFIQEKIFDNCKNIYKLPFDFYLPEHNILIEFDGEQHYKPINYYGGQTAFEKRIVNDEIKNSFALKNNIKLLRIKFDEINDIDNILNKALQWQQIQQQM